MRLRALIFLILCVLAMKALARDPPRGRGLVLGGEPGHFTSAPVPELSPAQIEKSVASTRAGLAAWAKTSEGREWVEKLGSGEYEVVVTEDGDDQSLGEAPQPGIATLVAAADRKKVKYVTQADATGEVGTFSAFTYPLMTIERMVSARRGTFRDPSVHLN